MGSISADGNVPPPTLIALDVLIAFVFVSFTCCDDALPGAWESAVVSSPRSCKRGVGRSQNACASTDTSSPPQAMMVKAVPNSS